jgi:hypothetical protein
MLVKPLSLNPPQASMAKTVGRFKKSVLPLDIFGNDDFGYRAE